jgi:disulfide bond formation protein DsbB
MLLLSAVLYLWKGPLAALIVAAIVFYAWGMALAHSALEVCYESACRRDPWKEVSEGAEMSIMVWFLFSWPVYYLARPHAQ